MNTKIILGALCAGIVAMSTACSSEPEKMAEPAMTEPTYECVLTGDWEAKADESMDASKQRSMKLAFSPDGTTLASGMYQIGAKKEPGTSLMGSKAIVTSIEGGKEDQVMWKGAREATCKMKFVEECAKLQLTCEGGKPLMLERAEN